MFLAAGAIYLRLFFLYLMPKMESIKNSEISLLSMQQDHYDAVKTIYELGIATQNATLETKAPAWEDWDKKHLAICRIVAMYHGQVVGWAALSPVSVRCVYGGVAEDSVYIHPNYSGQGIGVLLFLNS
jgi:L-amino acid N-acyltransferase YncA